MNRRRFLASLAAGAASLPAAAPARRPNIVVILADDLGFSDLGCYGNRVIETPNLDRLAERGVRFTSFYTTSPVCSPSRAALITGRHPQRYNIHRADLPESLPRHFLPASAPMISKTLKAAGYYTAHIGKWHLGEPPHTATPREQGFDLFAGSFGGRPSSPWNKYARSMDPEIIVNEERPAVRKGHVTDVLTAAAIDALDRAPRDRPFFLNLWYTAPHEPLAPLPHQGKLYRHWSSEEQTYFQTVTDLDAAVGRVLAKLEEMGARDTLVLFSSDNGPEVHRSRFSRGSAWPLRGMKTQLWEGGVREPGILSWPGRVPAGLTFDAPASFLDVFPTLCAAARIPVPPDARLDGGIDLVAEVNGAGRAARRPLFFEYHYPQRGGPSSLPMAVRLGRWKLFASHDFSKIELYDLAADIGERHDVAARHPETVRDLRARLEAWWAQFAGKFDITGETRPVPVPTPEELEKKHYRN